MSNFSLDVFVFHCPGSNLFDKLNLGSKTSSYLFKNTAYVTITNTCNDPIQIAVAYTGCKVYRGTGAGFQTVTTLYPGNSAKYRIETPALWKKGKVVFGIRNYYGGKYSYTISQSKVDSLKRTK